MKHFLLYLVLVAGFYIGDLKSQELNDTLSIEIPTRAKSRIVCVGGLISVGKSTFISKVKDWCVAHGYSCKVMDEIKSLSMLESQAENITATVGFYFGHRVQMAIDAPEVAKNYDLVIMERSHLDHLAFVQAMEKVSLLSKGSAKWTERAIEDVDPPDPVTFVYLSVPPEIAMERQVQRGDGYEDIFTLEFTKELDYAYRSILKGKYSNPIFLDWINFGEEYDFDELIKEVFLAN